MLSDLQRDVFVEAIIMFVNSFHGYMQRCPHSTSMHDIKPSISMEENLRKGKAAKKVIVHL